MSRRFVVREGGVSELGLVEPLFRSMVEHHRGVAGADWPVRESGAAWALRRAEYEAWLGTDHAWLLLAVDEAGFVGGYAVVQLHPSGPSWELGERIGELESLAVSESVRGEGVGTKLIESARELLKGRGISYWSVSVVEANTRAVELYAREGFKPFYRQMLAKL